MTLYEYIQGRTEHCHCVHQQPCPNSSNMLYVAQLIVKDGLCTLHEACKFVCPNVKYVAVRSRSKLLHMPLVSLLHGTPASGRAVSYLVEKSHGTDYVKMATLWNRVVIATTEKKVRRLGKSYAKMLLNIAQSYWERQLLQVVLVKAAGMTPTEARRHYGFERMEERSKTLDLYISKAQAIREQVEDLARTQDYF